MSLLDMKNEMRRDDLTGDPWGTCLNWHFDLCDFIHFISPSEVPSHWVYAPGAGQTEPENDCPNYPYEDELQADLIAFGNLLSRYASKLKQTGKDY